MISRTLPPKTKRELVDALAKAGIETFTVYEGIDLSRVPIKSEFVRNKANVEVLRFNCRAATGWLLQLTVGPFCVIY